MTPEHTALVAELEARELYDPKYGRNCKDQMSLRSAAAIRALAGENQDLRDGTGMTKLAAQRNEAFEERDTLRAALAEKQL